MTSPAKISIGREYTHKFRQNDDLGQLYLNEPLILVNKTRKSMALTVIFL